MDAPPNLPTPDWGTLGPGSDIKPSPQIKLALLPRLPAGQSRSPQAPAAQKSVIVVMAMAITIGMFFFGHSMISNARRDAGEMRSASAARSRTNATRTQALKFDAPAQHEAEQLLQRATTSDAAATAQVEARAATYRGHIALTPHLTNLITAGLNATDLRVRAAAIQMDLAAMNVAEDQPTVERLLRQADSTDHATRIWAIWTLGLVANRGIERDRITNLLVLRLAHPDLDTRHWAVEALSYIGSDATIPPLLRTLHDDPAPSIRERAACALAQSGMLANAQRRTAIPTLLAYAEDPSLDTQTHAWTYHALRDITSQSLPDDAGAWRNWYNSNR
jgi:HEAT repeat protein